MATKQRFSVKALVVKDGRVLLLRAKIRGGFNKGWDLPGGHVQAGESTQEALEREVREETGLVLRKIKPTEITFTFSKTKYLLFLASVSTGPLQLSAEHCDYKWVTLAQLAAIAEQVLGKKYRNLVQDLQGLIKNDDN